MPVITINQIFGNQVNAVPPDGQQQGSAWSLIFGLGSFANDTSGGEILDGLGFDNPGLINPGNLDDYAVQIFYAILLLTMQNQATGKNDDPEQKIYIAEGGISVISFGSREGQLERRFTVSIFSDGAYGNTEDVDSI
ncbi:MAG: hypothetical protein QNJ72_26250 [Pleurocapsa sp. MO_226.B13]|nr:hypothetical protein [Pleurocapsa sp. MO_226.B13]